MKFMYFFFNFICVLCTVRGASVVICDQICKDIVYIEVSGQLDNIFVCVKVAQIDKISFIKKKFKFDHHEALVYLGATSLVA